jgi:predicted RNA-binding Zn-ribbon protein involved in translation (DUF1610 family)
MTVYKSDYKIIYHKPDCEYRTKNMTAHTETRRHWRKCQVCHDIPIPEKTPHCPDCGRAGITPCSGGIAETKNTDHDWRCDDCGNEFDNPDMRIGKGTVRGDTVAGKLDKMSPNTEIVPPSEVDE